MVLRFALANGTLTGLAQPRGSRHNHVGTRCIRESTPIRCKSDVVNGAVGVIAKLAGELARGHVPKPNCKRRRINGAPTDQISAVGGPCQIALPIAEDFVAEGE